MQQVGSLIMTIDRTGKQPVLQVELAGCRTAVSTALTFEDLERLARYVDSEVLRWRRDRNQIEVA
jgi:hypothetical protein